MMRRRENRMDMNRRSSLDSMSRRSMRGEMRGYRDSFRPRRQMELPRSTWSGRQGSYMERGRRIREMPRMENYRRPGTFRKGVRDAVWENAKDVHGRVRDPKTRQFMSKSKPWDMGHRPGMEFRKHQKDAMERGISQKQWLDEYNDPRRFRPELPSSNRSHRCEDMTDRYISL